MMQMGETAVAYGRAVAGWGGSIYACEMTELAYWVRILTVGVAAVLLVACRVNGGPRLSTAVSPTAAISTAASPTAAAPPTPARSTVPPTALPPIATSSATSAATSTATFTATPTPHPLGAYTIPGMRARDFPGGAIQVGALLEDLGSYGRYAIGYPSDGLTITGTLNVPAGEGPFPVAVLLHGYVDRAQYLSGADTWRAADFLARHGYLTIAPDFRSWGGSGVGHSFFHMGLVADTLNLISSLASLPQADPARVGLWGHSMGGGIATKVLVIDDRVATAVLYAPNSADDADLIGRWGPGCLPGQSMTAGDRCNPAEVIGPNLPQDVVAAYLAATADPAFLRQVAPLYHLEAVGVPVQIHIGTADGAALTETPPEWSEKLYAALQEAGKDVAFFSYPEQGHFFQGTAWDDLMARTLALFDAELKP